MLKRTLVFGSTGPKGGIVFHAVMDHQGHLETGSRLSKCETSFLSSTRAAFSVVPSHIAISIASASLGHKNPGGDVTKGPMTRMIDFLAFFFFLLEPSSIEWVTCIIRGPAVFRIGMGQWRLGETPSKLISVLGESHGCKQYLHGLIIAPRHGIVQHSNSDIEHGYCLSRLGSGRGTISPTLGVPDLAMLVGETPFVHPLRRVEKWTKHQNIQEGGLNPLKQNTKIYIKYSTIKAIL